MTAVTRTLKDSAGMRWVVVVVVSIALAMNYYFYDALSPLKDALTQHLGFSSTDYGIFTSAYSIPNVFLAMAVLGGIILDKIGIRITGNGFFVIMVLGAFLTYYGATDYYNDGGLGYGVMSSFMDSYSPSLKMMTLGFFLFGLGAETSIVVITKVIVKWFKGREVALALGINLAIARLGTALAFVVSPRLLIPDWTMPIFFGAVLMTIGLLAFIVYTFIDIKLDRQVKIELEKEDPFRFADLGKLVTNPCYIYITLLCVTFYSAVFPFMKYAPDLMMNKFGFKEELAGDITSLLPFGTILLTPLIGWITDTKGKSATLMMIGSLMLVVVHLMFSLTNITPWVPIIILGMAFSMVPAAMWPAVSRIVDESRLGTAYGLMFSVQNIGLWLFPMLIGWVLDRANPGVAAAKAAGESVNYDYTQPVLMLAGLGIAGLVFAFLLKTADKRQGYGLEQPNKQE